MSVVSQFSYPLFVIMLGILIAVIISRISRLNRLLRLRIMLIYAVVAIVAGLSFQYPASPVNVETVADVETMLINEKPTFVMLYSNY